MQNEEKIILDLCGGTGSWSKPYQDAGYDVRVISLPLYDVRHFKIKSYEKPYGILCAPPCTEFSFARNGAKKPRDLKEGMIVVNECLRIIHEAIYGGNLKFWAMENPKGYLRRFLGKPPLTFNPFDYGDAYSKATDLWGFYKMPAKSPVENKEIKFAVKSHYLPVVEIRGLFNLDAYIPDPKMDYRQIRRSVTPAGFANQFFKANR